MGGFFTYVKIQPEGASCQRVILGTTCGNLLTILGREVFDFFVRGAGVVNRVALACVPLDVIGHFVQIVKWLMHEDALARMVRYVEPTGNELNTLFWQECFEKFFGVHYYPRANGQSAYM